MAIDWKMAGYETPPVKERLLLIISAAGDPPDTQLMDQSEIAIGYWTNSSGFRPLDRDPTLPMKLQVTHWALLREDLPPGVVWQSKDELRDDFRD
jgi:hypothetical protein